jgi:hypothetical protein
MQLAFAATMIRLGRLPDSNTARKLSASEFSHSLDPKPPFPLSDVTALRVLLLNRDAQNLAFSLGSAQARP